MPPEPFPVIEISPNTTHSLEPLGTKAKFWFQEPGKQPSLFKEGRPGMGENWAEKIACEVAQLLGLPHAHYDLACYARRQGVVSPSFVPPEGALIHGNEVLEFTNPDYKTVSHYRSRQHTIGRIYAALREPFIAMPMYWPTPASLATAFDVFVGYLLLDALIGNTDRHHENWGLIWTPKEEQISLAPTFDHASSMGRNESDEKREARLTTRDKGFGIAAFAAKARSAIYHAQSDTRPMMTMEAFHAAAHITPPAGQYWLNRLDAMDVTSLKDCLDRLPPEFATDMARRFALELMKTNRERLLAGAP